MKRKIDLHVTANFCNPEAERYKLAKSMYESESQSKQHNHFILFLVEYFLKNKGDK